MNLFSLLTGPANMILNPFNLIFWLLMIGALAMAVGYRTAGRRIVYALAIYLIAILLPPSDVWTLQPLENRFARGALPDHVDGVLVLDGGADAAIIASRGAFAWEPAPLRLIAGAKLLHRFPGARLIYTGGSPERPEDTNAVTRIILEDLGIAPAQVMVENKARNTWENLVLSKELVQPKEGENWVLVTSALHMPRAMGVARHIGWTMIPWPSDYLTRKDYAFLGWYRAMEDRLRGLSAGLHEWAGLIAYRIAGRIDTLFPGPQG